MLIGQLSNNPLPFHCKVLYEKQKKNMFIHICFFKHCLFDKYPQL